MACQELLCDLGKGSALAALARSPFAGLLNLGVDASLDQRQPLPGLLTCLLKGLLAGPRPGGRRVGFLGLSGKRPIKTKDRWPLSVTRKASPGTSASRSNPHAVLWPAPAWAK